MSFSVHSKKVTSYHWGVGCRKERSKSVSMMSQTYENQKMDTHFLPLFWFQVTILGFEFVVHEAINRGRGEGTSCSIYSQHHNLLTVPTFAFLLPHIFRLSGLLKEKLGEEVSGEGRFQKVKSL